MSSTSCLYLCAHTPLKHHETVLAEFVSPLVDEIRGQEELASLFFVRMDTPTWQVRLRVVGEPAWIQGPYRELAERHLEPHRAAGRIEDVDFTRYEREVERYGGEEGMALAEKIYTLDTLACLELLALERRGKLARTRRELALILGERFADLLGFDAQQRGRFYDFSYRWTREMGTWDEGDLAQLHSRYEQLRPQFSELFRGDTARDPGLLWGGEEAAAIAEGFLEAVEPLLRRVVTDHAAGILRQELAYLGWSYTHLFCNRLGLSPTVEAILRYLMHRFLDDAGSGALS